MLRRTAQRGHRKPLQLLDVHAIDDAVGLSILVIDPAFGRVSFANGLHLAFECRAARIRVRVVPFSNLTIVVSELQT